MISMFILKKDLDCYIINMTKRRKSVAKAKDSMGTFVCLDRLTKYRKNLSEAIGCYPQGHSIARTQMRLRQKHILK
jgi:hypothetical protein